MNLKCVVQEKQTKEGKPYVCLYIEELEKVIFLTPTEVKLLTLLLKSNKAQ